MGNSDLTRATTTPRTSDHSHRATKPRTSGTGWRLARGRCSHLLSPSSASGCVAFASVVSRGEKSGGTARRVERTSTTDSIGVSSHSGGRRGCAPGVASWLWRARPVVSAVGTWRGSGTSLARQRFGVSGSWKIGRRVRSARSVVHLRQQDASAAPPVCRIVAPDIVAPAPAGARLAVRGVRSYAPPWRQALQSLPGAWKKAQNRESGAGVLSLRPVPDAWPEVMRGLSSCGEGVSAPSAGLNSLHVVP